MVAQLLPPVVTAIGRYGVPYLFKEYIKKGATEFGNVYGSSALQSINTLGAQNQDLFNQEFANYDDDKDSEEDKTPTLFDKDETKQPQQQPPKDPDPGYPFDPEFELSKRTTEEVIRQTKELEKKYKEPKVEFGPLTETEKQTARALMGNQPEFFSRVAKSIKDAKPNKLTKNKWKSYIQGDKQELKFLGLDKFLQGNESITKQELLDFVDKKNIASNITVRSIPKDEMNTLYGDYSLGFENEGTQENIVFQFGRKNILVDAVTDRPYDAEVIPLFRSEHFDTEYGTNTFAHARTQVGFGDSDAPPADYDVSPEDIKKFNFRNTLIVDEIQSDYIQRGQDKGFISDFDIVPEDKLIEYLEKNNIFYKLSKAPTEFTDKESGVDVIEFQQSGPIKPGDAPILDTLNVGYDKNFIFNKSDKTHYVTTGEGINPVQYLLDEGKVPDFPIKESKKFVELVLNKMIEKAVLDGRDSIAITNGQIQANRYDAMREEEKEGLKKFYDEIVLKQLEKIANKYNVKLEKTNISEGEAPKELQDIHFNNQIKKAQEDGFVLKKVDLQFLWDRTKDTYIPGHAALYSDRGVGQGADFIENYLTQLVQSREPGSAASGLSLWDQIKKNEVYIWIKEQDISRDRIGWELPIVPVKDAYNTVAGTPETQQHLETLSDQDIEVYTQYLKGVEPPEDKKIGPEQLIKMKLPKKLQKDILSKPIKLSKAETQTDRLFA